MCRGRELLLVLKLEMLYVDSLHPCGSLLYRRLLEVLAGAKLTDCTGLLELPLEFLEGSFDVLAFFDWNYDHDFFTTSFFLSGCKDMKNLLILSKQKCY